MYIDIFSRIVVALLLPHTYLIVSYLIHAKILLFPDLVPGSQALLVPTNLPNFQIAKPHLTEEGTFDLHIIGVASQSAYLLCPPKKNSERRD